MNTFGFILVGGQMVYGDAAPEENPEAMAGTDSI